MVRHAPIHRRLGHSDIAICCGRNVRGSSPSTLVVPLSNQVTTLNHKRFKGFKMFSDGHLARLIHGQLRASCHFCFAPKADTGSRLGYDRFVPKSRPRLTSALWLLVSYERTSNAGVTRN